MFENIINFFKRIGKREQIEASSKDTAKERLHLVLMQDRANVSADFLDMMRQEIIEVIKKYIDVDEKDIDVRLTNKTNEDGTTGAPALYANIPITGIREDLKKEKEKETNAKAKEDTQDKKEANKSQKEANRKPEQTIKEKVEENEQTTEQLKEGIEQEDVEESIITEKENNNDSDNDQNKGKEKDQGKKQEISQGNEEQVEKDETESEETLEASTIKSNA